MEPTSQSDVEWSDFSQHPKPWGSIVVTNEEGNATFNPDGSLRQYFVDSEGRPILDGRGRRVHVKVGPDLQPARTADGELTLIPID